MRDSPDPALLAAILADPDRERAWLALAGWFRDNGRDDEAATLRVFWSAVRDSLEANRALDRALEYVRVHADRLGPRARAFEDQAHNR